jgi:hypothetical protein
LKFLLLQVVVQAAVQLVVAFGLVAVARVVCFMCKTEFYLLEPLILLL